MDERPFVVAISSRALFDLDESHQLFEREGLDAYMRYQIAHEDDELGPGIAFALVQKLLGLNDLLRAQGADPEAPAVEVILLSRNSGDTGLRIFNSIEKHGLDIVRAAFTNGASPYAYIESFGADLFLSAHAEDVLAALRADVAAATILPSAAGASARGQLRIAFDGDAVLFDDTAERIYQTEGLKAFAAHESAAAAEPLSGGPFKAMLHAIHRIQSAFPSGPDNPIRTALVTARSAPAHKRVILTLRRWGIRLDEALFLGGKDKGPFLKAFGADIFFDDQATHCASASSHVATGHVPHGVTNES